MSSAPTPQPKPTFEQQFAAKFPTATRYMKSYAAAAESAYKNPTTIPDPFTTNSGGTDPHFGSAMGSAIKPILPNLGGFFGGFFGGKK
jgi:hypothetical protein